jgi:hypothetical protein
MDVEDIKVYSDAVATWLLTRAQIHLDIDSLDMIISFVDIITKPQQRKEE